MFWTTEHYICTIINKIAVKFRLKQKNHNYWENVMFFSRMTAKDGKYLQQTTNQSGWLINLS